jgi:hypothetical protein
MGGSRGLDVRTMSSTGFAHDNPSAAASMRAG